MLKFEHVTKVYGGKKALNDLTLSFLPGHVYALVGPNGSGKSTLAKLINGLFIPTGGSVTVNGMDTRQEKKLLDIRKCAGMVFQNPDNQMVATIVEEDVAFGPENLGVPHEQLRGRVDDALRAVNMLEFAKSAPHHLSGGQKQRIAIAGILAMEPEILIMDEATAMLDPKGRAEVLDTVKRLNREKGITVVYITHFMEETVEADRIVVMGDGTIQMTGTPQEVFAREEELDSLTLEVPEVTKIARELQSRGIAVDRNILTLEELAEALCQFI